MHGAGIRVARCSLISPDSTRSENVPLVGWGLQILEVFGFFLVYFVLLGGSRLSLSTLWQVHLCHQLKQSHFKKYCVVLELHPTALSPKPRFKSNPALHILCSCTNLFISLEHMWILESETSPMPTTGPRGAANTWIFRLNLMILHTDPQSILPKPVPT